VDLVGNTVLNFGVVRLPGNDDDRSVVSKLLDVASVLVVIDDVVEGSAGVDIVFVVVAVVVVVLAVVLVAG